MFNEFWTTESLAPRRAGIRLLLCLAAAGAVTAGSTAWHAQAQGGGAMGTGIGGQMTFERSCTSCHAFNSTVERAPKPDALMQMPPEAIYAALTNGVMMEQAKNIPDPQKRLLAEFLGGRPLGAADAGDAAKMTGQCTTRPPIGDLTAKPSWNGWSADLANTRFQTADKAGLTSSDVPNLTLKWAFGFPNGAEAFGQPTIAGGRVFVGSDNGYVYSLDAVTGCVYWSFRAQAAVRSAISVGRVRGAGATTYAVYFGDLRSNAYGVDAATGKQLWTAKAETHPLSKITGAPALYDNRLYVPVSSSEEVTGSAATYPCCTFRGSVVAYDASTGKQLWKAFLIPEAPTERGKNAAGTQLWTGAGSAVWSAPTVDPKRGVLYVGTGDAFTEPAHKTSDAIVALDLKSGAIKWIYQALADDAWIAGCNATNLNCPKKPGPDFDIAASPILRTVSGGKSVLVGAHKGGVVFAIDPDRKGAQLWTVNLAERAPGANGLIVFGGAADAKATYFGLTSGGIVSLGLEKGDRQWFAPLAPDAGRSGPRGHSAALTAMPGVILSGGWDGVLRAISSSDGKVLWQFDTQREFRTTNGVVAKGGSMGAPGPTVAGGMVFVGSGYAGIGGGRPGNVLLAFGK